MVGFVIRDLFGEVSSFNLSISHCSTACFSLEASEYDLQFNFAYDSCSNLQLKLLIGLMIALSSRIGECLALTWSDVYDNEDKHEPSYIRVYKQLVYRSEEFIRETNGRGILKVFDQVRSIRPDAKRRAVFHVTKTEKKIARLVSKAAISGLTFFLFNATLFCIHGYHCFLFFRHKPIKHRTKY